MTNHPVIEAITRAIIPHLDCAHRASDGKPCTADYPEGCGCAQDAARAALAAALESMKEPSEGMVESVCTEPWIGHPEARQESIDRWENARRSHAADTWQAMLERFEKDVLGDD